MSEPRLGSIFGKVWGTTQVVFDWNNVEVNRLLPIKSSFCSEHRHHSKHSRFFVLRGKIHVKIFRDDLTDVVELGPGGSTDIPPNVWHQFDVDEDSDVIEIYWVELDADDIERRTKGGVREPSN